MDRDLYTLVPLPLLADATLSVRIASLQGRLPTLSRAQRIDAPRQRLAGVHAAQAAGEACADVYVEARLYADNRPLCQPVRTRYRHFRSTFQFNETLHFPVPLASLPLGAQIGFSVWDAAAPETSDGRGHARRCIGGTTLRLFGKKGTLKRASHRLYVWSETPADGSAESTTPSKMRGLQAKADVPDSGPSARSGAAAGGSFDEMGRLEKLIKAHDSALLPRLSWLDKLTYRQIERINAEQAANSDALWLYVDLPRWEAPVVWCETEGATGQAGQEAGTATSSAPSAGPQPVSAGAQGVAQAPVIDAALFTVFDPEVEVGLGSRAALENLSEAKSRRLARSHRNGPLDRELKPNAGVRDELNEILSYPPTRTLTSREADLLWTFRFYLSRFASGLTKFLKSVSWNDPGEAKQATDVLLPMWARIGMDDALELLGPGFRDSRVRAYAVQQLERADDDELILYLLQLVQALKFDDTTVSGGSSGPSPASSSAQQQPDRRIAPTARLAEAAPSSSPSASLSTSSEGSLWTFLVRRALQSSDPVLANNLYWYLTVETEDKRWGKFFKTIKARFLEQMLEAPKGAELRELFRRQSELLSQLSARAQALRSSKDSRPKKIDKLRAAIADPRHGLRKFSPVLPLPLDARVRVEGIAPEASTVFKSNLFPLLLQFERSSTSGAPSSSTSAAAAAEAPPPARTEAGSSDADAAPQRPPPYGVIFKNGDDLRQDQLVMQLFTLMDRLLRNENLDLRMTPYRVLATGPVDGMVQFVESKSIAAIVAQHGGSLLNYLRAHHPDESSPATYGVAPVVLDTFVRSCAGYCVVTYLLGIGDRHLDNLLLAPDGHFFHVDFGYILGRDPKPFPPALKLSREMVEAMGGAQSPHYARFKSLCYTAYTSLRKNSNLILNLVALMVDANIPDIRIEPDKAVLKVQDKFRLDLGEEEAIQYFEGLLNETSYVTLVFDRLHDAAQFFRS